MFVEIFSLTLSQSLILILQDVPSLQGGQLSWKEMAVEGLEATPCSRKANKANKRPRIITIDNVQETVTLTTTSIITEPATATATFTVTVKDQSWLVTFLCHFIVLIPARQLHPGGLHVRRTSLHRSDNHHYNHHYYRSPKKEISRRCRVISSTSYLREISTSTLPQRLYLIRILAQYTFANKYMIF